MILVFYLISNVKGKKQIGKIFATNTSELLSLVYTGEKLYKKKKKITPHEQFTGVEIQIANKYGEKY